ncbi:ATP-binding cassette domain-containing protein [Pedobacter suwonensis]|uniref:ATP-binding cassette domain-containing protein n=1 Tax=Pedobacter suwonensis TaxID=332999 RepID=UPI0036C43433
MNSPFILETRKLSYSYRDGERVIGDINLKLPESAIYGFLGANGAGKTTTLKLILGLLDLQQGEVIAFQHSFHDYRRNCLRKIGSMIESPSIYGHLTAKENLLVLQRVYRCAPSRIDQVLAMVGLSAVGAKKAGQFSLGMKQRLAFAMALLHEPSLLILDEPTNGLDPNGMIEVREFLINLNRQFGTSMLISSHLLAEMEKLVTHVGIIHKGKLLFQDTLKALQLMHAAKSGFFLSTDAPQRTFSILSASRIQLRLVEDGVLLSVSQEDIPKIISRLVDAKISVYQCYRLPNDLETIFLEVITKP